MNNVKRNDEKELVPLRINDNTVLLVPPEKCNEEYANKVRVCMKKGGAPMSMKYFD
jgi:hypothetical protein